MKNMTKRIISFVLCLAMLVGLMPGFAFGAEAEGTVLDAAIFCSDVHGSTSDLTSVLGGVAKSGVDYSSIGFVGDTCLTVANTTSIVQNALGDTAISVMFSYASSHDTEDGADIDENWDYSGEVEGVSEHYLVYTIRETDMQNSSGASSAAPAFTKWYNGLTDAQKALPIFILSHRPLHDRRDDNAGAATWYDAISAAAESSDIVFFWAHNHTGDNSVDQAAYYVAKDGTETFTVYNGDTVVPNFTYMNAGYINANNQNPKRLGVATTVQITADSLIFQDYNSSGTYTGTYAHNVTVDREFAAEEEPTVNTVTVWDDYEQVLVEATALGLTGVTATNVTGENEKYDEVFTEYGHVAVNIGLDGVSEGASVDYSISVVADLDVTNLELYYVEEDGTLTPVEFELVEDELNNMYVEFTSDKAGTFVYGSPNPPEGYTLTSLTLENIPTDVFLGTSLSLDETAKITATYTMEGAEDFVRVLTIFDYDYTNFSGYDVNVLGEQTVIFTFEGLSVTHDICVWGGTFADETTGVTVALGEGDYGVTGATVTESANENVAAAVADVIKDGVYEAYDISLNFQEGYEVTDAVKTVTLPIPEGVGNPAVYYVSEDGAQVESMTITAETETTVTFETTHFSTYVIGESTEIQVPDPETATGSGESTTTTKKTVYVLTSSISSGNDYLIVNGNAAGNYYALANNSGSVAATGVEIKTDSKIGTYIELDDATDELWTVSNSYRFQNGNYYLGYTSSGSWNQSYTFGLSTTARTWSYSNNRLSTSVGSWGSTTYYLQYSSGWTWTSSSSASGRSVYFYVPAEVDVETTTTVSGTYSIEGEDLTKVVTADATADLKSTLIFTPDSGDATTEDVSTTATYTVVEGGDPKGVISGISGNTVTFSGNTGKALVKVSYETTFGTVTNYIVVNASEPTYELDITSGGNVVTGTTVASKGVTASTTLQLGTQIRFVDEDGAEIVDLPQGASIEWNIPEEYHNIATVNKGTGLVTFKGVDGAFYVTATLTVGGKDYTVGVNISATTTQYSAPTDGTEDFPEYPNEGAIRFDKTATAVGNFSQTGIAQVELSMTGVPYTTGSEIDVVVMLDMTGSMDDVESSTSEPTGFVRVDATIAASKAFISTIVKNEDGSYNGNRVGVYVFNKNGAATLYDFGTVNSDTELNAIYADLESIYDDHYASGGTPYDDGLSKCYEVLKNAKTDGIGNNRQQFTVFMTDGVPTSFAYVNGTTYGTHSSASAVAGMLTESDDYATRDTDYKYEYYSTEMKKAGVTVYSVGVGLENTNNAWSGNATQCLNLASALLNDISGPGGETTQPDAVGTSTHSKQDEYFFSVEDSTAATDMTKVFSNIAQKILQAATDVTVEDKITDEYTMIFDIPEGSKDITGVTNDFYIEFVKYDLDDNHERTTETSITKLYLKNTNGVYSAAKDSNGTAYDDPVFEAKTVGDKGTLYYWSTNASDGDTGISVTVDGTTYYFVSYGMESGYNMTSGAYAEGAVDSATNMSQNVVIATPYFVYNAETKMLYWTLDKLDTTEYALRYFLYLENSATEVGTNKETDPGSYPTNEHAYITYTNFKGNDCRQEFPEPQMTWNGAQVSYVFYLVNANGQPINKSGQIVDFANATFITDVYTKSVVWNKEGNTTTGTGQLSADWLADDLLPEEYEIYDEQARYILNVYENADGSTIKNEFTISGNTAANISSSLNTRLELDTTASTVSVSTTKVYNTKAGEKISAYGTYTSADEDMANFDFANTTVAFAVVWQPRLVEDTVVVDFGLDVLINVVQNDILQNAVSGIGLGNDAYDKIAMNTGVSTSSKLGTSDLTIDGNTISIVNDTSLRFHQGDMEFKEPAVFYYETPVEFWEGSDPTKGYMYSSVTVIPATTIYYEDEFVTYEGEWETEGTASNKTQQQDRPGKSQISAALDADNNYGYDAAYENMGMLSMDSAHKITVSDGKDGMASFDFYGTGFDIISMTDTTTGTIFVRVYAYNEDGTLQTSPVKSHVVDTYYGYAYGLWKVTYTYIVDENGANWVITEKVPVEKAGSDATEKPANPVSGESTYVAYENKWYTVDSNNPNALYQVPVMKISGLDYGKYKVQIIAAYDTFFDNAGDGSYDFYLDAIRIYDPTGNENKDANDAYAEDNEGRPTYKEVRNYVIDQSTAANLGDAAVEGIVFIDSNGAAGEVADYTSYGPNNELYLAPGQAIAFELNATATTIDKIQLALKSVYGSASAKVYAVDGTTVLDTEIATATDMYHDITGLKGKTVVIMNTGNSGVLSITNVKVTYTEEQTAAAPAMFMLRRASVDAALATMSVEEDVVPEETVPETTAPEETVPEETIPEETVPETTVPEETEPEETEPEETQPEENEPGEDTTIEDIIDTIGQIIRKLFGWIFG